MPADPPKKINCDKQLHLTMKANNNKLVVILNVPSWHFLLRKGK